MPKSYFRGGLCRCVNKYSGDPIFGVTGGEVPSMEEKQNCQCASTYFEALQQACRMHLTFESKYRVEQYKVQANYFSVSGMNEVISTSFLMLLGRPTPPIAFSDCF